MEPMDFDRQSAIREEFATETERLKWAVGDLVTAIEARDKMPDIHLDQLMKLNTEVRNLRESVNRGFASVVQAIYDASGKRPRDADDFDLPEKGGKP